jgi:hypothetical protein
MNDPRFCEVDLPDSQYAVVTQVQIQKNRLHIEFFENEPTTYSRNLDGHDSWQKNTYDGHLFIWQPQLTATIQSWRLQTTRSTTWIHASHRELGIFAQIGSSSKTKISCLAADGFQDVARFRGIVDLVDDGLGTAYVSDTGVGIRRIHWTENSFYVSTISWLPHLSMLGHLSCYERQLAILSDGGRTLTVCHLTSITTERAAHIMTADCGMLPSLAHLIAMYAADGLFELLPTDDRADPGMVLRYATFLNMQEQKRRQHRSVSVLWSHLRKEGIGR